MKGRHAAPGVLWRACAVCRAEWPFPGGGGHVDDHLVEYRCPVCCYAETAAALRTVRAAFRAGFVANIEPSTAPQRVAEGRPFDWTFDGGPHTAEDNVPQAFAAWEAQQRKRA